MTDTLSRATDLLGEGRSTEAYEIVPGAAQCGLIVLADHARNTLPDEYGTLGLAADQFHRHIAYDIGVEGLTRALAADLGAPAILTKFSRLLIDPNRGEDDPTLIMRLSDGAIVPSNREVSSAERMRRLDRFYRPYHDAIDEMIACSLAKHVTPTLLSIHSFTPAWKGTPRPWHIGVLWDKDPRFAQPLLREFGKRPDLVVGDNEPYSGEMVGDCMWRHGTSRNLPHAILEIRQDLIAEVAGQKHWAQEITRVLKNIQGDPAMQLSLD